MDMRKAMATPNSRDWERLALLAILVVGFVLRFQNLGAIEVNLDQVYPIWQALDTLGHGHFPLAGQGTSVLFANPTLTGYIFLPLMALTHQLITAYILTISLNSLAIYFAYRGLKRLMSSQAALIGTALFAANPWVIEESRRTWVQCLMPFLACLIFWALVAVITRKTPRPEQKTLIALVGLAIFANTYLLSYALAASVGLLILIYWRRIPKKPLLIGGAIFVALFSLYIIGLARQWGDTKNRTESFAGGNSSLSDEALNHALRLVTGWEYPAARGVYAPARDAEIRNDITNIVHRVLSVILLAGVARALYTLIRCRHTPQQDVAVILLIWFWLPVLMMTYVSKSVHPHYLLLTLPAGHGLVGWALEPLWSSKKVSISPLAPSIGRGVGGEGIKAFAQYAIIAGVIFTMGLNGLNTIRFAQESTTYPGNDIPWTLPIDAAMKLGAGIRANYQDGMVVYTQIGEWPSMAMAGKTFPAVYNFLIHDAVVIPKGGGLYVEFHAPTQPINPPAHGEVAEIPIRLRDGTRISLWELKQNFKPMNSADIPSDVGIRFIGWWLLDALRPGQTATLRLYWQVDGLAPERGAWNFAPYAHVLDNQRQVRYIADGTYIPALTWRVGDWMIYDLMLQVPADIQGPITILTGFYDSPRGVNAIFNYPDASGQMQFTADLILFTTEP
ncbi:MAG: hypothetical protein HY862_12560 [Chloroflexi bacterium]|nr:hypothetical protein [Chloroflexota bacterium]